MSAAKAREIPRGDVQGFSRYFRADLGSGFLVFLIALPLCLGISLASGYPAIAGVFTAIIGAVLATFLSNSELTIKGPAAGLIVIVLGCVQDFGGDGAAGGFTAADLGAYRAALAVGVAAAALQIVFGLRRGGILGDFFPLSAVHGMLAAIGVIIIAKQIPVALGVSAKGEPLELLREIPHFIAEANPAIALIGIVSLAIMFLWPYVRQRFPALRPVPAPLVVLLVSVPMGMMLDLLHEHFYVIHGHKYPLGEQFLVSMPDRMFGMFRELTFPDFSALRTVVAWKWVLMFFIIGSLESMLSAKAVDLLDPYRRKTNLDRDVVAIGAANLVASMVGGLPMISEIVRSKANIDNGAKTRYANLWHGLFLLACVALIPTVLHRVPLAALAAMLVYTGTRLAHPHEFLHVYRIGREQLVIFAATLIGVLATDLLIGIGIGILVKLAIHVANGVPVKALFKTYLEVEPIDERTTLIRAGESAVFSNWIPFRRQIEDLGLVQRRNIVIDLTDTHLVDHSVMEKLHELQQDFVLEGLELSIIGLETHQALAEHDLAARRGLARVRRLTITADESLEGLLEAALIEHGVAAYTVLPCRGVSRCEPSLEETPQASSQIRIEIVVSPSVCQQLMSYLRKEVLAQYPIVCCVESVEMMRRDPARVGSASGKAFQAAR